MSARRIVPDNSVLIPAFFKETLVFGGNSFDLSRRSRRVAEAIRGGAVRAFAPDLLHQEFLEVAYRKARPRSGIPVIDLETMKEQFLAFASLRITAVPASELTSTALDLVRSADISPADSWYVACALHADAELWISHDHADKLVDKARSARAKVFTLTTDPF
jgi:predicted nucleic acid-binding protein